MSARRETATCADVPTRADPLPALCLTTIAHLPALERRFVAMCLRVAIDRTYQPSTGHVTLTFLCDAQSDTLCADELRVRLEAKQMLIDAGFYVATVAAHGAPALRLTGYYGSVRAAA